jgi:hypothetical protein
MVITKYPALPGLEVVPYNSLHAKFKSHRTAIQSGHMNWPITNSATPRDQSQPLTFPGQTVRISEASKCELAKGANMVRICYKT